MAGTYVCAVLWVLAAVNFTAAFVVETNGTSVTETKVDRIFCETDRDCPEQLFCYSSKICIPCYNCTEINRLDRIRCSKRSSDCGDCLPGFKSDSFANSSARWCRRESTNIADYQRIDNHNGLFAYQWFGVAVILCITAVGFASYHCYNNNRSEVSFADSFSINEENSRYTYSCPPPPPYKEEDHTLGDDSSIACSFQLRIIENCENDKQKAVPFFYTENMRPDNEVDGQQSANAAEPAGTFMISNIDIHDETTVASVWTPGPSYLAMTNESQANAQTIATENANTQPKKRKRECENEDDISNNPKRKDSSG